MRIVPDSNVLCADYHWAGLPFRILLAGIASGDHSLYIPAVVLDEVKGNYRRQLHGVQDKAIKMLRDYSRITAKAFPTPVSNYQIDQEAAEYEQWLAKQLRSASATLLPYPDVSHEQLAKRAVNRRRPFSDSGSGYRDSLVWETAVRLAESKGTPVALVSADNRAFADEHGTLHTDLLAELDERQIERGQLSLFPNLRDFVDRIIRPRLEMLDEAAVRWQLESGIFRETNFAQELAMNMKSASHWEPSDLGLPAECEDVTLTYVEEVRDIRVEDVRRLSDLEFLVQVNVTADAGFEFFMYKPDYYVMDEPELAGIEIWDFDWSERYLWAYSSVEVEAELRVTVATESGEITAVDILSLAKE